MRELLEKLTDKDNKEILQFYDNKGRLLSFEQVAVIPYDETLYTVLHPIDKIEGVNEDEAIVFEVTPDDQLQVVTDVERAQLIFDKYLDLLMSYTED